MEFNKVEIAAFEMGYRVDKNGVLRNNNNDIVKCSINSRGYLKTGIRLNSKVINILVHRLQAYIKYGNKIYDKNIEVRHLNGVKTDNSYDNILIGSHIENMLDIDEKTRIKKAMIASKSRKNAYSKDKIYNIKKDRLLGMTYKQLMDKYNISSKGTVNYILNHDYKYFDI